MNIDVICFHVSLTVKYCCGFACRGVDSPLLAFKELKRQNPFLSIVGIVITATFLVGFGLALLNSGGKAFSPGRLSSKNRPGVMRMGYRSHDDFEEDCALCHQPLTTNQNVLCLVCHTSVEDQIRTNQSTHSYVASEQTCASCHSDHLGQSFDPTEKALSLFDHSLTQFSLNFHRFDYEIRQMECDDCHNKNTDLVLSISKCAVCHERKNPNFITTHITDYGNDCIACHDGKDRMIGFEHQTTDLPLTGAHALIRCRDCHAVKGISSNTSGIFQNHENPFENTPGECVECHAEPEIHSTEFPADCAACHTTSGWSPAHLDGIWFDHQTNTSFVLGKHRRDFNNQPIRCKSCHTVNPNTFETQQCVDCHSQSNQQSDFMNKHIEDFGRSCLSCHDGVDRMSDFSHDNFFLLEARHAEIACMDCHANQRFSGTPRDCASCHAEPVIHEGFFGTKCQYCHTSQAWFPAPLRVHSFPLNHGEASNQDCKTCHTDSYAQYNCYSCHEHEETRIREGHLEEGIQDDLIKNCIECHITGKKDNIPFL